MNINEVRWIRSNSKKLDKVLTRELLKTYTRGQHVPCFMERHVKKVRYKSKKISVIIRYKEGYSLDDMRNTEMPLKKIKKSGEFKTIPCCAALLTPEEISKIVEMDVIKMIHYDYDVKVLLESASQVLNLSQVWEEGYSGKGVGIAIVDTGIYMHNDLIKPTNRIKGFYDVINHKRETYDDNGHGTHCAGDAAGNGYDSNGRYKGPAYQGNLIGVKVLDKFGSGKSSNVIAGIEWCLENKDRYNIRIISLSLGSTAQVSYQEDPLCEIVEKAWDMGIVVCAAAGNDGPKEGTINTPGITPKIITVGSLGDKKTENRADDKVSDFSSRGPTIDGKIKPDLLAPGSDVISLRTSYSYNDKQNTDAHIGKSYTTMSGTSMATPICAGVVAVLLEVNPRLKPDEVKNILMKTAVSLGVDKNMQGSGYINASSAVRLAKNYRGIKTNPS